MLLATRTPFTSPRAIVVILIMLAAMSMLVTDLRAQQERSGGSDSLVAASLIQEALQAGSASPVSAEGYRRALALLNRAIAAAQAGHYPGLELVAFYWTSYLFRMMGASDSALEYGGRALKVASVSGIRGSEAVGLFALAQVYSEMERPDSLLAIASRAISICQQVGGCWFYNQLYALTAPFVFNRVQDIPILERAAAAALAQRDTVGAASLDNAIGLIFVDYLGEFDSALVYYRKVVALKQWARETVYGLGRTFRGLGIPDSARLYFGILESTARQIGDLRSEGYALANIGGICHRDMKPPVLACALAYYDSAASIASQVLRRAGGDLNRVVYGEQASRIYSEWPLAWLSLSDTIGGAAARFASLAVAELGRSEALRDLMGHLATREGLPVLGTGAPQVGEQLVGLLPAKTATLSYLMQDDTLLAWLTLPSKEVRVYRWPLTLDSLSATVRSLRTTLGADDALAGSRLRGAVRSSANPAPSDSRRYNAVAKQLAVTVIPRDLRAVVDSGTNLVLIPQGVLNLVPFAVLPVGDGEMLGERFPIRYSPSLITLIEVQAQEEKAEGNHAAHARRALVVSDPTMPIAEFEQGVRMRLSQLPAADSEGEWVAHRLGAHLLNGGKATETEVRREIAGADIVHFATHAFAYPYYSKVRDSYLALAPDSTNDGLLTVGELMDDTSLSIPARLIVLSGCETALGSVTQGEGTVGLQRAFLARGARALLVSLWSVDDEATELLMKRFYDHWLGDRDGPGKAEALQRAQSDVRSNPRLKNPLYWAAFEVVGAN